jgi:anti-sigma factor RsiW
MSETPITCELVDEQDLDTRYLAGTLDAGTGEAFEAHYFGCDRCFELVQRGLELRAALAPMARAPRRSYRGWLALAAGIGAVGTGALLWRLTLVGRTGTGTPTLRGGGSALAARASARDDSVFVGWGRVAAAGSYRLRLYTAEGDVILERELGETALAVSRGSLAAPASAGRIFAQVLALDSLHHPLARSDLVEVPAP